MLNNKEIDNIEEVLINSFGGYPYMDYEQRMLDTFDELVDATTWHIREPEDYGMYVVYVPADDDCYEYYLDCYDVEKHKFSRYGKLGEDVKAWYKIPDYTKGE